MHNVAYGSNMCAMVLHMHIVNAIHVQRQYMFKDRAMVDVLVLVAMTLQSLTQPHTILIHPSPATPSHFITVKSSIVSPVFMPTADVSNRTWPQKRAYIDETVNCHQAGRHNSQPFWLLLSHRSPSVQ